MSAGVGAPALELTILMPCLNEAETLEICIRKSLAFLAESGIEGEVLVADNGSDDGSRELAAAAGARVVPVAERGYGAALLGGIAAARSRFVIMGDADDSYDFTTLGLFVQRLRAGADLVMGNRFRGGIAPGAMPALHRYLGNPVLSFLGRLFFRIDIGDFHCGLRGFDRDRIRALELATTGMEFASEMVVRAALAGYRIVEVPTKLSKDGRSRPPHLRTWRDGWRHLRFLLLYSPRWLFLIPGLGLFAFGLLTACVLLPGPVRIGRIGLDIHTFIVACVSMLLGLQLVSFAAIARRFGARQGFLPSEGHRTRFLDKLTLERLLLLALLLAAGGVGGIVWCTGTWASRGFGALTEPWLLRVLVISATALASGVQLGATAFLSSLMEVPTRR
jgi:glycosyltransferase involved in cell wall biosynthesis